MMEVHKYKTNLRCGACVAALAPILDADPAIKTWSVDLDSVEKPLTVEGDVSADRVADALKKAGGYSILGEVVASTAVNEPKPSYYPLFLILLYIIAAVLAVGIGNGTFDVMRAMRHFMAGFFLVFSFFKLLDLRGFAASFGMYDLVTRVVPQYGFVYPFIEFGLGLAYLANVWPFAVNVVTLIVMTVGTIGVIWTMREKRAVRCACLGTVINLPVGYVTLFEDALMAVMAAGMLFT